MARALMPESPPGATRDIRFGGFRLVQSNGQPGMFTHEHKPQTTSESRGHTGPHRKGTLIPLDACSTCITIAADEFLDLKTQRTLSRAARACDRLRKQLFGEAPTDWFLVT